MKNVVRLGVGISLLALATGEAYAQDVVDPAATLTGQADADSAGVAAPADEILVTGVRATQRSAIAIKQRNEGITEVLNAEDIGQLPERNIADAVQRLAGVAGNNDKGRSNTISLRGLGGAYTLTTVNDRQVASSLGTRSVNLDLYPAEVVARAVIQKTPAANQTDGGVGGTVNIATFRPLNVRDYIAVNAQAIYSPDSHHLLGENGLGYRASFVISKTFADDTLGVLFGASRLRETIMAERFTAGAWSTADYDEDGVGGDFGQGVHDASGKVLPAPLYIKQEPSVDQNRRDSLYGSIQWRPSPNLDITIDALYSQFKTDGFSPFLNFNFFCDSALVGTERPGIGVGKFHSTSTCIEVYAGAQYSRDKTYNFGGNIDWQAGDFNVKADIAYSRAPRRYNFPFADAGTYFSNDVTVDFTSGDTIPQITVGGVDLADPTGQDVSYIFLAVNETAIDTLKSAKLDITRELENSFIKDIAIGGRYSSRHKNSLLNGQFLSPPAGGVSTASVASPFPFRKLYSTFNSNVPNSWMWFNPYDALKAYGTLPENDFDQSDAGSSFDLTEDTFAGYAQVNFGSTLGKVPFTGNLGVRVIKTDITSKGFQVDYQVNPVTGTIVADPAAPLLDVTTKNSYTNVLPSLNLNFNLSDELVLRAGAAVAIIRPDFYDLRASTNINIGPINPANPVAGSRGNPLLRPIKSRQADLSLEWYPTTGTYFAVAGFYKKLDSFHQDTSININGGGAQSVFLTQREQSKDLGGDILGVELSGSYELAFLPGFLRHLTVYGNVTKIDIKPRRDYNVSPNFESFYLPLGMTESTYNVGMVYDDDGLTATVNYYGQGASAQQDGSDYFLRRPFQLLSASIGYRITSKITVNLSGNNLLKERQNYGELGVKQQAPNAAQLYRSTPQGRTLFAGVRFQF